MPIDDLQTQPPAFNKVVITDSNDMSDLVMLGGAVGDLNGVVQQNSIPQLIATAYFWTPAGNGSPVSPQPTFKWYSSNPNIAVVDQSGNVTRAAANPNGFSYNSNGASTSGGAIGQLVQIRAVALRADGSETGYEGVINVAVQGAGFSQIPNLTCPYGAPPTPATIRGFYNLVPQANQDHGDY